ncbi:hypothetical protein BDA96_03G318200 [Sorghum bicolor]|uniref:Uncharacterized protein n=2 Tax=Sorghum bicolor TaxID=4558 RepID=A0A921RFY1_SORBI|nr:hypothetical protein BDA96_03G318200 [Sorghum bicolor]KXG33364.1 hypothetical protein SORBI_3003G294700 [Sorghum bicolor]
MLLLDLHPPRAAGGATMPRHKPQAAWRLRGAAAVERRIWRCGGLGVLMNIGDCWGFWQDWGARELLRKTNE